MKRILSCLLALLLLPVCALADVPEGIWAKTLTPEELHPLMLAAMSEELPGAALCTDSEGAPMAVYEYGSGFCVARRADGLITLCCFYASGDALRLLWHNDLLLSSTQELAFSAEGPVWSGGSLPELSLAHDTLTLWLELWDGSRLRLLCKDRPGGWLVTEMGVYADRGNGIWVATFTLPEDCLSGDISLARCYPGNWNATEAELR